MNKKLLWIALALGWLTAFSTFAYQGNPGIKNPNPVDPVRHESMEKALETKDYSAWKALMAWKWVLNKITTEAQFLKFVEMREAFEKWDITTAQKLQSELWLWQKKMDGSGQKKWMGKGLWKKMNMQHN